MHSSHHMKGRHSALHALASEAMRVRLSTSADCHHRTLLFLEAHDSPLSGTKVAQQSKFQPMEVRAVGQETPSGQAVIIANPLHLIPNTPEPFLA